jgi:hypothetical protein
LSGWLQDESGARLPGVTLTATSPNLQGSRVAASDANGNYKLVLLPPGTYTVSYELESFATAVRQVKINAGLTTRSDPLTMRLSRVEEEIVVKGEVETISKTTAGAATFEAEEVQHLPMNRDLKTTTLLAPGVHIAAAAAGGDETTSGSDTTVTISGAMSFQNLFLMNGVVLNENIRGQPYDLFIEDAILETTVLASGISTEYGRFSGGVVNAITKSGGNRFDGSLRATLNNNDWEARTPLSAERKDDIVETLEATLGGYFWKDHLWFFGAARDTEVSEIQTTRAVTHIPFDRAESETRYEAKLTISPHPSHSAILSYFEIDEVQNNSGFGAFLDLRSLTDYSLPQQTKVANYTGILTPKLFVEAQYSEREFFYEEGGAKTRDLLEGTLMRRRNTSHLWHSPTFCGAGPPDCPPEERSNTNLLAKGSYFLTNERLGSHEVVFGYDTFDDIRFNINRQTGSDFTVWASDILVDEDNNIWPQFLGPSTWIGWFAVFNEDIARPTSFTTNSFYVNDSWQLNDHWSFNLGVRYDENDGQNSEGVTTADDAKWSPRLGLSYDVKGDGDLAIHGSYGSYVAAVGHMGNATSVAGFVGEYDSFYGGPTVNVDPACAERGDCVSTQEALAILFDWYFQNGTRDEYFDDPSLIPGLFYFVIPARQVVIPDTLRSPAGDEIAIGVTKRLGTKGLFRGDLVFRDWSDFFSIWSVLGETVDTSAGPVDLWEVGNSDELVSREYRGLHTQFRYRVSDRLTVAGNYTLSKLEGNFVGEAPNFGPTWAGGSTGLYPEYWESRWRGPEGDLEGDQRHKLRTWAVYDILDSKHHSLTVSWLENYFSGLPYGAQGRVHTRPYVTNPGYARPPSRQGYWFTGRDAFRTDSIHRSDFALNYAFRWKAFGREMEVFLQPEVLNLFNEQGVDAVNKDVADATQAAFVCPGGCQPFNPFTETPVEGVHWAKRDTFGQPEDEFDYQFPRTFRFSVGFRF